LDGMIKAVFSSGEIDTRTNKILVDKMKKVMPEKRQDPKVDHAVEKSKLDEEKDES
jgi:hypothetical protein